jgi:catechol 2,3-dioxygenase-like lactoylglutathione lyase family enzyme
MPMTPPLSPADLFHTGIVVPELAAAAEHLSTIAGYTWTKPIEGPVPILTHSGTQTVDLRFVYSMEAPHVELIEQVPGTPWLPAPVNAVHHLGYFTDDFDATAAALAAAGFTMELCHSSDGERPSLFAYYRSPDAVRVEVVDHNVFGDLADFLKAFQ